MKYSYIHRIWYNKRYMSFILSLYAKAIGLQNNAIDYKSRLKDFNSTELLKKALDKGEITLIDYILELTIYYESINKLLRSELEMNKTVAELNQYL